MIRSYNKFNEKNYKSVNWKKGWGNKEARKGADFFEEGRKQRMYSISKLVTLVEKEEKWRAWIKRI